MRNYNLDAGRRLRALRCQRGLTLKQAAFRLQTSAPVLSRKERGQDAIERLDIRLAIVTYQLDPQESYALWLAAGFVPEIPLPNPPTADLRTVAERLLSSLDLPAFISDNLGYLYAWNQPIETLWALSQSDTARVHILDHLFSIYTRYKWGEMWASYSKQALRVFYRKTIHLANAPEFHILMDELQAKHGETFITKWYEARQNADTQIGPTGITIQCDSPVGPIDYLGITDNFTA